MISLTGTATTWRGSGVGWGGWWVVSGGWWVVGGCCRALRVATIENGEQIEDHLNHRRFGLLRVVLDLFSGAENLRDAEDSGGGVNLYCK